MSEDLKVTISLDRYNERLNAERRAKVLAQTVLTSGYSVSKETVATILGFELPKDKKEEAPF